MHTKKACKWYEIRGELLTPSRVQSPCRDVKQTRGLDNFQPHKEVRAAV